MNAREAPVPGTTMRAARREAERTALSLVRAVRRAWWLTAGAAGAALAAGLAGALAGPTVLLVGWPALALCLGVAVALRDARRRPRPAPPGVRLHPLAEGPLNEHLARLARDMGARCPSEVRVVPGAHAWLDLDPDRPVLYLGAPLLWHLDLSELDRLVAGAMSRMRALLAPEVRPGLTVAARLDSTRLAEDQTPLAGVLVRGLGRRLGARQNRLHAAVRVWADGALPPPLRATAADLAELHALREVDEIETTRRAKAAEVGVGLRSQADSFTATLVGCEQVGAPVHAAVRPAASLLRDPVATDRSLSQRVAAQDGVSSALVERRELPWRVWLPLWRRERDAGLPAVVQLTGRWPRTLAELVAVVSRGSGQRAPGADPVDRVALLGALLSGRPQLLFAGSQPAPAPLRGSRHLEREADRDEAGDQIRHEAVVRLVAAAVRVAAIEQGRLELSWHDVWGAQLVDGDGEVVPVEAYVRDAVAQRDAGPLTLRLQEIGVSVETSWEGAEPPPGGLDDLPVTAFAARQGRRGVDIVVVDGWLLGYPHPSRGRWGGLPSRVSPSDTDELLRLARTHRNRLVGLAGTDASARLADVVSARLDASADGRGWTLRLELPERLMHLAGDGPVAAVAETFTRALGDRLACGAAARVGLPARSWVAVGCAVAAVLTACLTLAAAGLAVLGLDPTGLAAAADAPARAVAVLALGSVPVLLLRAGEVGADRARCRRAPGATPPGPRAVAAARAPVARSRARTPRWRRRACRPGHIH